MMRILGVASVLGMLATPAMAYERVGAPCATPQQVRFEGEARRARFEHERRERERYLHARWMPSRWFHRQVW
jgi:hypothetical protein